MPKSRYLLLEQSNMNAISKFAIFTLLLPISVSNGFASDVPQKPSSEESACALPYPKGAPVINARNDILKRFLETFEYWDQTDDGEIVFSRASKDDEPAIVRIKRSPRDLQKRLNFIDAAVLTAYPSYRVCDSIYGELFPSGISLSNYRMNNMVYHTKELSESVRNSLPESGQTLIIRAIPRRVLSVFPTLYTDQELDARSNFRLYKSGDLSVKALQELRKPWINLLISGRKTTREEIEKIKEQIDQNSKLITSLPTKSQDLR